MTNATLVVFGEADANTLEQMANCMKPEFTVAGALMADCHLGYSMPIGGVVAYRDYVSPSGVGYDIGCGNKAVRTNLTYGDIKDDVAGIMDRVASEISFGMGRSNNEKVDHDLFDDDAWQIPQIRKLKQKAAAQLGTVGSGNHYVDLFAEVDYHEDDFDLSPIWIGVHFGSRGLGHTIASGYMSVAKGGMFDERVKGETMMDDPILIPVDSELGGHYLAGMELAGRYAYAGRDYVCDKVLDILGATGEFQVHNHHNFAWLEEHGGERVWVVRKGATPAFDGDWGFIGGSMGDIAVIVRGVDSEGSDGILNSTIHGAGRVMSRTKAAGKRRTRTVFECSQRDCEYFVPPNEYEQGCHVPCPDHPGGKFRRIRKTMQISEGVVDFPAWQAKLKGQGIELRGGGADEAPEVYKNLTTVLNAHSGTIDIEHVLKPIGVAMAGADVVDHFKD